MTVLQKGLSKQEAAVRSGRWEKPVGLNLQGTPAATVRFERIGRSLSSKLSSLRAKVSFHEPAYPDQRLELRRLLSESLLFSKNARPLSNPDKALSTKTP